MDFLFASQDASTASLVWLTCLLCEQPDVLQKVAPQLLIQQLGPLDAVLLVKGFSCLVLSCPGRSICGILLAIHSPVQGFENALQCLIEQL